MRWQAHFRIRLLHLHPVSGQAMVGVVLVLVQIQWRVQVQVSR
jgi:hypothetical protein